MRLVLALLALGAVSFFYELGAVGLIGPDESRYAEVARGMMESGDWVTPRLQGKPWLDKPPLFYWAAAGSMRLFGQTEAAVRLPAAIASLATCLVIAFVGARVIGFGGGLRSALVLAGSLGMVLYGRAAIMDSMLTLALTLGLGAYLLHTTIRPSPFWLAVASGAFGVAVLAKGPIGIVLPLLIIGPFHWIAAVGHASGGRTDERHAFLTSGAHWTAATVPFLLVVVPWHAAIVREMGWEYVEVFLFQHNVDRFLTTVHRHPGPFYYYLPVLAVALFPWSAFLPAAILRAFRRIDPLRTFLLLWIGAPLLFFSLAGSKLPGYVLPILPPCALLVGLLWTSTSESMEIEAKEPMWLSRSMMAHAVVSLVLGAAVLYACGSRFPDTLTAGAWFAVLVATLGIGVSVVGRRRPEMAFWSLTASSVASTLALVVHLAPAMEPHQSLKTLATRGFLELEPGENVICYKAFYPRAHFYTRDRLGEIWTLEEFRIRADEWGRIVTLTEPRHYQELVEDPSLNARVIARTGRRILVEARPVSAASR